MEINLFQPLAPDSMAHAPDVRAVKILLNHLGYYHPYNKVGITGIADATIKLLNTQATQQPHGTPQNIYTGTNGVTVVVESTGRNAGKIVTSWRHLGLQKMKIKHSIINTFLQTEDIEGFIELGSPADEYLAEAVNIAAAISQLNNNELDIETITAILALEWVQSFDLSEADIADRSAAILRVAKLIRGELEKK